MLGIALVLSDLWWWLKSGMGQLLGREVYAIALGVRLSPPQVCQWRHLGAIAGSVLLSVGGLSACQWRSPTAPQPRRFEVQQKWALQPGQTIANHRIVAGLGDVSIELDGAAIYAPFTGEVQPATEPDCFIFSSPEVPAYLFRFCGIRRTRLGLVQMGQPIGSGDYLHFATFRREPNGTWLVVEPATDVILKTLQATMP